MIKCPYCGQAAMSPLRKSALGPGRAVNCQSCGKLVASHWTGIIAAIPAFLGGLALLKSESVLLGVAAVAGGLLLMGLLHTYVVPLMKAEG